MPRDNLNSTLALCFPRVEATSGYHKWCQKMVPTQRLYCVLYALRRHQGTMIHVERCCDFNCCIVFYMHWGDTRVPWLLLRDASSGECNSCKWKDVSAIISVSLACPSQECQYSEAFLQNREIANWARGKGRSYGVRKGIPILVLRPPGPICDRKVWNRF